MNRPSIHFHTDQVVVNSLVITPSTTLQELEHALGAKAKVEPETKLGVNSLYAVWEDLGIEGRLEPVDDSLLIANVGIRVRGYSESGETKSFYSGDATLSGIAIPPSYTEDELQRLGIDSAASPPKKIYEAKDKPFAIQVTDFSDYVWIVAFKSSSANQERQPSASSNSKPPFSEYIREGCGVALGKLMMGLIPLLLIAALIVAGIIWLVLHFVIRQ